MSELLLILAAYAQAAAGRAGEFSSSFDRHPVAATHTTGEVILVVIGIVVVAVTTVLTLFYFIRPSEKDGHHIKRRILADDAR